jgi:hypothetical protein
LREGEPEKFLATTRAMKILAAGAVLLVLLLAGVREIAHHVLHERLRDVGFSLFSASPRAAVRHEGAAAGCPTAYVAPLDPAVIPAIDPCANGGQASTTPAQSAVHTITVKFDYDFTHVPVCSGKPSEKCVQQFIVYDISGPKKIKLFSLPPPPNAKGKMTGITATSPKLLFVVGYHRIGVSAASSANTESVPFDCHTVVKIEPNSGPAGPATP